MIITIDGPIATGKSTIARILAEEIGFIYFDTGAMYRCLTYGLLKDKVNIDDPKALQEYLDKFSFDYKIRRGSRTYFVDKEDVTAKIRSEEISNAVSEVAAIRAVRDKLVSLQRKLAEGVNAIFEGRDMGTIVFPNASLKIFLYGRPEVRAQRRFEELRSKFPEETKGLTMEKLIEDINARDTYDSTRENSPLRQADDAFVVDTSDLTPEEVVFKILDIRDTMKTHRRI